MTSYMTKHAAFITKLVAFFGFFSPGKWGELVGYRRGCASKKVWEPLVQGDRTT